MIICEILVHTIVKSERAISTMFSYSCVDMTFLELQES
jgi:hypothetical protein